MKKLVDGIEVTMDSAEETAILNERNTNDTTEAMAELRFWRNVKLRDTDHYALSDVTMSAEMTTYRQALRDLPSNYTTSDGSTLLRNLSNLNWPTKP